MPAWGAVIEGKSHKLRHSGQWRHWKWTKTPLRLVFNPLPTLQRKLFYLNNFSIPKQSAFSHRAALFPQCWGLIWQSKRALLRRMESQAVYSPKTWVLREAALLGLGRKSHFIFSSKKRSRYAQHESKPITYIHKLASQICGTALVDRSTKIPWTTSQ